jgi:hypothetical protein
MGDSPYPKQITHTLSTGMISHTSYPIYSPCNALRDPVIQCILPILRTPCVLPSLSHRGTSYLYHRTSSYSRCIKVVFELVQYKLPEDRDSITHPYILPKFPSPTIYPRHLIFSGWMNEEMEGYALLYAKNFVIGK